MFAIPRKIIPNITLIAGLLLPGLVQADATATCFNFLNAQDYVRAESEAKRLVERKDLSREEHRYAYVCLGKAYINTGRNQAALTTFQQVEALSQATDELATAYNLLGVVYGNLKDLDRAELYGQRALKAYRELGDKKNEAATLNNLATVVKSRGDLERALQLYREALVLQPEAGQAATLNNIAMIHSARKEFTQAIELLRQAIDIDRRNGDAHATATHQINLGAMLRITKQYPAAEKELLSSLNAIRLVGDKRVEAVACDSLGWLANDDPKKSIDEMRLWFKNAEALYREIGDTANAGRIAKLLAGK